MHFNNLYGTDDRTKEFRSHRSRVHTPVSPILYTFYTRNDTKITYNPLIKSTESTSSGVRNPVLDFFSLHFKPKKIYIPMYIFSKIQNPSEYVEQYGRHQLWPFLACS